MRTLLITMLLVLIGLTACTTTKYVPVETIKTEYKTKLDSVYMRDSIWLESKVINDTVYLNKYVYKTKETFKVDTLIVLDTIPVIREVEKVVVTNQLYWWQKTLMYIGLLSILLGCLYFVIKIKL